MKHFKLEMLAHICMVALAVASTANIGRWLDGTGENAVTAWGVAVSVGVMVVTLSVILSKIDRTVDPQLFNMMAIAAAAMCILSGTLQTMAYAKHINPWAAAALGYLLPLCGELLVGVAMSMYNTYQDEMILLNADGESDRQIERLIAAEMQTLDLSDAKEYMQRKAGTLARRKIDATFERILARTGTAESADSSKLSTDAQQTAQAGTQGQPPAAPAIEQLNDARQQQIEQRRMQFLDILRNEGDIGTGEFAQRLDVSPNTVRNDRRALEERGLLHVNGSVQAMG